MSASRPPLVSVVTPVYNGEKYLAECIESVLAQTYENWNYVIVNNKSNDKSLEIAQYYAKNDSRVSIHNNNQFLGAIQNQNHALALISPDSKYVKVVHADDWLYPECIKRMVELAEANDSLGIVGSYMLMNSQVVCDKLPHSVIVAPGAEVCRMSLLSRGPSIFGTPSALLIRSDIIRASEKFYNESIIHADHDSCYRVLKDWDFGFVHQVLSFSRVHDGQISTELRNSKFMYGKLDLLMKYGPIYLSREEHEALLNKKMRDYYRFLAKSVFLLRGKEFWNYHKNVLENIGEPLSMTWLVKAMSLEFLDAIFNPKMTLGKIASKF